MKTLTGHTSPETAYVVEDYPYGFRERTSIRYWIETKRGYGQRCVSQTRNPKTGRWNKPKAGTYSPIKVLALDSNGHVQPDGISGYASEEKLAEFERLYAEALTDNREREILRYFHAANRASARLTWSIHTCEPGCTKQHQTIKEQSAIVNSATQRELWEEALEAIHTA